MPSLIIIRGGGDLASGVAVRLRRAGLNVAITELAQPLAVRRSVSFSEAVYEGQVTVEELTASRVTDPSDTLHILSLLSKQQIPVLVDPECRVVLSLHPLAIVDARMTKRPPEPFPHDAQLYIGLGPGFIAGENCHAVIETQRGHRLGRVIWDGPGLPDSGLPDPVRGQQAQRVLRAPASGELTAQVQIGDHIEPDQVIAEVAGKPIVAPFKGVLRGLIRPGLTVEKGLKVGDLDPRDDPSLCSLISDKALAIGGAVLEALLTRPEIRAKLWT